MLAGYDKYKELTLIRPRNILFKNLKKTDPKDKYTV
jgi:hypothetical protein